MWCIDDFRIMRAVTLMNVRFGHRANTKGTKVYSPSPLHDLYQSNRRSRLQSIHLPPFWSDRHSSPARRIFPRVYGIDLWNGRSDSQLLSLCVGDVKLIRVKYRDKVLTTKGCSVNLNFIRFHSFLDCCPDLTQTHINASFLSKNENIPNGAHWEYRTRIPVFVASFTASRSLS